MSKGAYFIILALVACLLNYIVISQYLKKRRKEEEGEDPEISATSVIPLYVFDNHVRPRLGVKHQLGRGHEQIWHRDNPVP